MSYQTMETIGFIVFVLLLLGIFVRWVLPVFLLLCLIVFLSQGC